MDTNRKIGLCQTEIRLGAQTHITEKVSRVAAILLLPAQDDVKSNRKSAK